MKLWQKILIGLAGILVIAGIIGAVVMLRPEPFIPKTTKQDVSFTIFVPSKSTNLNPDKSSVSYDIFTKVLTYKATQQSTGAVLTFSQQSTPETFIDIPQVYDKTIENLRQYSEFDSLQGKVYLTHPKELNGGQAAVLNAKGTLMFVKPDKNLDDDAWKHLFNDLEIDK